MNHIIQNLISIITGFLTNLTTTDKSNLVAAINEVNAKALKSIVAGTNVTVDDTDPSNPVVSADSSSAPYLTLSGQISQISTDDPQWIEWQNTTGTTFTFTRIGVGHYRITPSDHTNLNNPSLPKSYTIINDNLTNPLKYLQIEVVPGMTYFDVYSGVPDSPSESFAAIYISIEFLQIPA